MDLIIEESDISNSKQESIRKNATADISFSTQAHEAKAF